VNHLEYLFGLEQFGIKLGLDNIRAILQALDHPERDFPSIHVAGTNGKGSVTAMVETGLRAAGYRTGRYTSPHLISLRERFAIDGQPVDDDTMLAAIGDVREIVESLLRRGVLEVQPTFFEVTTAVAFELFRRLQVGFAVVEVGLGGRLDATNVLSPVACAITSIAFDHQLYLGSTLREIALEKAGIIKPGVPVVVGTLHAEALAAIAEVARARNAPLLQASLADVAGKMIALRGEHQRVNAAIASRLLQTIASCGFAIPDAAIHAALADTEWPGRIDLRTLADGKQLLMDAAHNPAGAEALASYLRDARLRPPLVFAAMRDKDVDGMLRRLLPEVERLIVTRASNPRSAEPEQLARVAGAITTSVLIDVVPSVPRALEHAWDAAPLVVVAGSIFLLGDVMQHVGLHW
jgi:dihydrofolate synthase / folylpolyglutamate synthase